MQMLQAESIPDFPLSVAFEMQTSGTITIVENCAHISVTSFLNECVRQAQGPVAE